MNRRSFGFWGIDLAPAEFAKALAAAGVLRGHRSLEEAEGERQLLVWRMPRLPPERDAQWYADAWTAYVVTLKLENENPPRIEVDPGFDTRAIVDALWVHETLSNPGVGAAAIYIRLDEPVAKVVLEWPLRIGVLPSPEADALLEKFRQYHYANRLTTFVELNERERECDLLVLPSTLRESVAKLASLPYSIRCDTSIVLGGAEVTPRSTVPLIGSIRTLSRSAGVAIAPTPEGLRGEWFSSLIDEIAHNNSLDVALHGARREQSPLFVASRPLAGWTLSRHVGWLHEKVKGAADAAPDDVITLSPHTAYTLDLGESVSIRSLETKLRNPDELPWLREAEMATASLEIAETAGVKEAIPAPPESRWIQAQVYAGDERLDDEFRIGEPHMVRVRVAPDDVQWKRGQHPVDERELPEQDEHLLTVVFFEPLSMLEPQAGTILLPRRGASTESVFYFKPPDVASFEARITVLFQNRVLQTALLRGGAGAKIEVVTEAVVRAGMHALSSMGRGDVALVVNRSAAGPGLLAVGGGLPAYIDLDDVKDAIKFFDERISDVADEPELYDGLRAKGTVDMLIGFAKHGRGLHRALMNAQNATLIQNGERIQVVSAKPDARFPIEFVYDREIDQGANMLCTNAEEALRTGKCENDHPLGTSPGSVICPLAFWGLRKVIERHIHGAVDRPKDGDFAVYAEPADGRNRLDVLKCALLAATNKVDTVNSGGIARIEQALTTAAHTAQPCIVDWNAWSLAIKSAPTLLVLVVHVELDQYQLQRMEIGVQQFLDVASLNPPYVRDPQTNPSPLVLLLGCEAGAPKISFQGFVTAFRQGGASVVITSGSTILGRHVVPVTEALLRELKTLSATANTTIGEAMRAIRRSMLADGIPMVFALTAYGDADWKLA